MRHRPPAVVGVLQGKAPEGLVLKAVRDLSTLPDLDVRSDTRTRSDFKSQGLDARAFVRSPSLEAIAALREYDFLLIIDKRGSAFTLKSVNIPRSRIVQASKVPFPQAPQDWLEAAHNGWLTVTSTPAGGRVEATGRPPGVTPAAMLVQQDSADVVVRWG